jgi:hypothetical protein
MCSVCIYNRQDSALRLSHSGSPRRRRGKGRSCSSWSDSYEKLVSFDAACMKRESLVKSRRRCLCEVAVAFVYLTALSPLPALCIVKWREDFQFRERHDSRSCDLESNVGRPTYEAQLLTTEPRDSRTLSRADVIARSAQQSAATETPELIISAPLSLNSG